MTAPARLHQWHRHAPRPACKARPKDSGAYVPELSERLERDPNLTAGAKCCGRLIAGYAFRRDREGRTAALTVSWLMNAMGKARRTVQRYLRQLEEYGYIEIAVVVSARTRLVTGLAIKLLQRFFPRHHRDKWPEKAMNSAVPKLTHNYREFKLIPLMSWDTLCRYGMADALERLQARQRQSFAA